MKAILGLLVLVLLMAFVGWITFASSDDRTTVNIETQKIQADTQALAESGKDLAQDVGSAVEKAVAVDDASAGESAVDDGGEPSADQTRTDQREMTAD